MLPQDFSKRFFKTQSKRIAELWYEYFSSLALCTDATHKGCYEVRRYILFFISKNAKNIMLIHLDDVLFIDYKVPGVVPCKGESKGAGLKGEISRLLLHLAIEVRYYTFFFAFFSVTFNLG